MGVQKNTGLSRRAGQQKPASLRAPASQAGESSQGLQAEAATSRICLALTPCALRSHPFFACSMSDLLPNHPSRPHPQFYPPKLTLSPFPSSSILTTPCEVGIIVAIIKKRLHE